MTEGFTEAHSEYLKRSSEEGMSGNPYDWSDAVRDLALLSNLTLKQSSDFTRAIAEHTDADPYEVIPLLIGLLTAIRQNSHEEAGRLLSRLIKCESVSHRSKH